MIRHFGGDPDAPDFSWSTGEGLDPVSRAATKHPLVTVLLLLRLREQPVWIELVRRVGAGEDPVAVARSGEFGCGGRNRLIAHLLVSASRTTFPSHAYTVAVSDDGPSTYRYSPRFWSRASRGIECIARYGAHECLKCGEPLTVTSREKGGLTSRKERVLYHDACRSLGDDGEAIADRDAIDHVFRSVRQAMPAEREVVLTVPPVKCAPIEPADVTPEQAMDELRELEAACARAGGPWPASARQRSLELRATLLAESSAARGTTAGQ